MSCRTG